MVNYNDKKGYTLMEACVVMLIVSIIIAVIANVIPRVVTPKTQDDAHGHYECYYNNGKLYEQTIVKGTAGTLTEVASCTFTPPKYIKYLVINAVGGAAAAGGSAGEFSSTFYSTSDTKYKIELGTAGTGAGNGGTTTVLACTNSDCTTNKEVISASGGEYTSGANGYLNTTLDDVKSCIAETGPQIYSSKQLMNDFDCGRTPVCEIENDRIKVSYCRTNEIYKTDYLPYKRLDSSYTSAEKDMRDTQFIVNSPYPASGKWNNLTGTLIYYDASLWNEYNMDPPNTWNPAEDTDTPSLYKLTLKLKVNNNTTVSLMENYIKMMQINSGIASAKPGSISGGTSNPGAVLILW